MDDHARNSLIIEALASVPGLRLVYLFGSRASGRASSTSDWDIAVLADPPVLADERHRLASELHARLGAPVDFVPLDRAPIELAWGVISNGQLIFERSVYDRVEYEADVQSRYGDHLHVLRAQRADTILGDHHEAGVRRYREALGALGRLHRQARCAPDPKPR